MTVEEMKTELLRMEELSWGDERLLNRPTIQHHTIERMWKKYHKDTNSVSEGYIFIINSFEGLGDKLSEFDAEDYSANFFERMVNADEEEFKKANNQRSAYAQKRAKEILDEFNSRFDVLAVLRYAENSDPAGSKTFTWRNKFFSAYETLKEWAEM